GIGRALALCREEGAERRLEAGIAGVEGARHPGIMLDPLQGFDLLCGAPWRAGCAIGRRPALPAAGASVAFRSNAIFRPFGKMLYLGHLIKLWTYIIRSNAGLMTIASNDPLTYAD